MCSVKMPHFWYVWMGVGVHACLLLCLHVCVCVCVLCKVWVTKKFPFRFFIKTVFIRATEWERLGHCMVCSMSVQQLIKWFVQWLIKRSV